MSSADKNLSSYNPSEIPDAAAMHIGIITAEWNSEITAALLDGAYQTLLKHQCKEENIVRVEVPGSFELISGAQMLSEHHKLDAIICLGCVIRGETSHFDFICQSVSTGLTNLCIKFSKPFIFGVLTTENLEQARERAGGKHGNKGVEAAITAIKMIHLRNTISGRKSIGF